MTIDERLALKSDELDAYEHKLGLRPIQPATESEAIRLLDMSPEALRSMSPQEACDAAYVLRQFALHLQRAMNREQSASRNAEEIVRRIVSPKMPSMPGYSYEERRYAAIRNDEAASAAENARVNATLRLDRASYLSARVSEMARTLDAKGNRPR